MLSRDGCEGWKRQKSRDRDEASCLGRLARQTSFHGGPVDSQAPLRVPSGLGPDSIEWLLREEIRRSQQLVERRKPCRGHTGHLNIAVASVDETRNRTLLVLHCSQVDV
jgi:hypothetical protein